MSKSEWKDLPDFTNEDEYSFLDSASPEVWAWEFLRRNPEYKKDWDRYVTYLHCKETYKSNLQEISEKTKKIYAEKIKEGVNYLSPPKGEIELLANKWNLNWLYDPSKSYEQGVYFLKVIPFPQHIYFADHMDEFLETKEFSADYSELIVKENFATLVFDLSYPLAKQLTAANETLKKLAKQHKPEQKNEDALKPTFWKRHLRVLDALRTIPTINDNEISERLGKNDSKGAKKDVTNKEGKNYIAAAQSTLSGYRKILWHNKTPQNSLKKAPKK